MTFVPCTVSEWCGIGARLWDMVRQCGETQVQTTFINGTEMSDETLTVAPSSTGLCLILGNITKPWEDSSLTGRIANLRAFQVPNFENQLILPIVWVRPGSWGAWQGLIIAEGERLSKKYAHAAVDVQDRSVQLHSQVEEAHNNLSVREDNIAVAGSLFAERECALAGREQQLEATRAQLKDREARISAKEAQQAAWEAETAAREEAPATRRGLANGPVARQGRIWRYQKTTLKASLDGCGRAVTHGPTNSGAREGRQAIPPDVSEQFWVTTFLSLDAFALQYFSLDDHSATEEERRNFRAFDVTTWAPRIWDEGVSGDFLDLRGAYNYWKRADDQAQLLFDSLVAWMCAVSGAGSHRSLHEFGKDPTAGIPDAAHDGIRPRHPALQHLRPTLHRRS
ncbi:hypothetical protein TcYC6_0005290 [Trypanosoma cruzi]|nr:hypothetical protein TcYC6_0005290 [Trypanosoma cruzi]